MKDIYYKSSDGVIINLIQEPYKMLDDTDLFNWKWDYVTAGSNYPYITAFTNNMIARQFNLVISGSSDTDMLNNIEHFVEVVDRDVRLNKAGKLYYGDYYREVFFTEHTKGKFLKKNISTHGFTIVAENGDWKSEQLNSYSGISGGKYLNDYAVPSVSSNGDNYEYGAIDDITGSFTFTADFSQGFNVSHHTEFTFESVSANVQYRFTPVGAYTTVTPSDCPLTIDVSTRDQIEIKPTTFATIEYSMTTEPNSTYINWESAQNDDVREFTLDLGDVVSIESVTGLEVVNLEGDIESHTGYLQISRDNINWVSVIIVEMQGTGAIPLDFIPSGPENFRYIKITSDGPLKVQSRTFKIEAHFTGEEQNLATSVIPSSAPSGIQTYIINEYGQVELWRAFTSVGYPVEMALTLANPTTVVAINNLTLTSNEDDDRNLYIYADNTLIDTVTIPANDVIEYSWSGEVEASKIRFQMQSKNIVMESSNFEILEEQTEAPHRYILNENYVPSDVIITINGPTNSPIVLIGENEYGAVNTTLDDGEILEINTRDETVRKFTDDTWINIYANRTDESFNKIPVGTSEILWSGNLRVEIEKLLTRSDPKWN